MEGAGPVGQEVKDCLFVYEGLFCLCCITLIIVFLATLQSCDVYINCGLIIIISQNK